MSVLLRAERDLGRKVSVLCRKMLPTPASPGDGKESDVGVWSWLILHCRRTEHCSVTAWALLPQDKKPGLYFPAVMKRLNTNAS